MSRGQLMQLTLIIEHF